MMSKRCKDITGMRSGMVKAISFSHASRMAYWNCVCDCGNTCLCRASDIISQKTKSCGCKRGNRNAGGLHKHSIYKIHHKMKQRCYDKNRKDYVEYGGRGIKICDEWLLSKGEGFLNFYEWSIENGWKEGLTIDRINNDGNYEPNNCRWTTIKEQSNNTRRNRYIEYNGKIQSMSAWCDELNLPYGTIRSRIQRGWSPDRAFAEPIDTAYKSPICYIYEGK